MFSRLTKPASSKDTTQPQPPTTPKSKTTSTHAHSKSQSSQHAISSPSKIPVASNPSRSALNPDSERSNYLSFLFSQSQQGQATTPVKVNPKVQQSAVPQVYGHHDRYHNPYESEGRYNPAQPQAQQSDDVHMQTMKNTVNPAMLKQLANIPPAPPRKEREEPIRPGRMAPVAEDVHMRTVKHEPVMEKPRGLEEWEKRLVESADSKRKATVAQLCEYFLVDCEMTLTMQTFWNTTVRYKTPDYYLPSHTNHQSICSDTSRTERRDSRHSRPIPTNDRSASPPTFSSGELIAGIRPRIRQRGPIIQRPRTCPPPKETYKAPSRAI
jgi:hypothetical protein